MIEKLKVDTIRKGEVIRGIIQKRKENLVVIQKTEEEWEGQNYEITYTINKVIKGSIDQSCLDRTVQKLINDEPLTDDCEKIFAAHIDVERKRNDDREINAFRVAQTSGYLLGDYCTSEIRNSTKNLSFSIVNGYRKSS